MENNTTTTVHYIYKIWFLDNPKKCYIGRTNNPANRKRAHKNSKGKTYKDRWVAQEIALGKELQFTIVAQGSKENIGEIEQQVIKIYIGLGYTLTNLAKGGNGSFEFSEYQKRRLSNLKKGTRPSESCLKASREYWTGRPKSEESRRKMSEAKKGTTHSQEYKDHMSEVLKERGTPTWAVEANTKDYVVTLPSGEEIQVRNIRDFADSNGLDASHLSKVARGKLKSHKGYKVRYL